MRPYLEKPFTKIGPVECLKDKTHKNFKKFAIKYLTLS
jgi:hypothetical protein